MPVDNRQYHDYDGQHDDFPHLRIVILSAAKDLFASQAKPLQNCHPSAAKDLSPDTDPSLRSG